MPTRSESQVLKNFGRRLKLLRSVFGYSRPEFAKALQIEKRTLEAYEKGKQRPPLFLLREVTGITQCDLDFLISGKAFGLEDENTADVQAPGESPSTVKSAWYWETDADHIVTLTCRPVDERSSPNGCVGWKLWDYVDMNPRTNSFWRRHLATRDSHRAFENFVYKGHKDFIRLSGKPAFGGDGRFLGYRGYASAVSLEQALTYWRVMSADLEQVA